MATIALYVNKINQMPGLIKDVKKSVTDYKSELCNLEDVISSIQSSSQIQEQKIASLDAFKQNNEEFVSNVARIDSGVADIIKQRKDDFYEKYTYLKPECEKNWKEKAKDWFVSASEWCKEHWAMVVTIVVVIAIAAIAAICGVAIAFIAAVAGIISLVLCIADVICMLATGKDIATICRENGLNVLADVFQGVSIGADIVSIVFPMGAAIKTMAKVGVKKFAQASIEAAKTAFKETIEKVFKSGFKNGIKNALKITFKTFIFDIDDFTKMENGKRILDLWEPTLDIPDANKHWTREGDKLIPKSDSYPKPGRGGHSNPDGLSMEGIMRKYGFDSIPLKKNGDIDWTNFSIYDVNIKGMSEIRVTSDGMKGNFNKADEMLKLQNISKTALEEKLNISLTWHENVNLKTMQLIPTEIHANIRHVGGVGNYKFTVGRIPAQLDNILQNVFKFSSRTAATVFGQ